MKRARPIVAVPRPVLLALPLLLVLQLLWHPAGLPSPAGPAALPPAPSAAALRLASLGEPLAMSRLIMLYVQAHDDQAGLHLRFSQLDYGPLSDWLERALELDPRSQYPLLAASQVYAATNDPVRSRLMLDLVYRQFSADPNRRWPWLAHAALVARHRLHDRVLARRYASAIRTQATGPGVPAWARQLEIFILQDLNEADAAAALIGGLIDSGQIQDRRELAFLAARLEALKSSQNPQTVPAER